MSNKDLKTVWERYPILLKKYDPRLNDNKEPQPIYSTQNLDKITWRCPDCGTIYPSTIHSEIRKIGFKHVDGRCDTCRNLLNSKVVRSKIGIIEYKGVKSLKPVEELTSEGTDTEWICDKHGNFTMSLRNADILMFKGEKICPECRKEGRISNTVADYAPHLVKEWDPNNTLSPYKVSYGSRSIVGWICSTCGHKWQREVKARTILNRGCPECNHKIKKFAEEFPQFKKNFSPKNDFPFEQETLWSEKKAIWVCDEGHESVHAFNNITTNIKTHGRKLPCPVCAGTEKEVGINSLFDVHPELIEQWDYEVNAKEGLDPNTIGTMYNKHPVHFKCTKYKHPYTLRLDRKYEYDKAGRESCPYCDNREAYPNFNDLTASDEDLAKEYSLNNERPVTTIMKSQAMSVLWTCPVCKGDYYYPVKDREVGDDSCPYCSNKKVLPGKNDLVTTDEDLAKEYSPYNAIPVSSIMKSMKLNALWICPECKGEYSYPVNRRELGDDSCPYCSDRKPLKGVNTLKARYQDLMRFWDYEANMLKGLDPDNILPSSSKKVRWKCYDCGTAYKMIISDRVLKARRKQNPCNCCNGRVRNKLFIK